MINKIAQLAKDYFSRHQHPVDLILHVVGVPQVLLGVYQLVTDQWGWGLFNIFFGYFLQWIGHRFFEKNEVGEIILMKKIAKKLVHHQGGN